METVDELMKELRKQNDQTNPFMNSVLHQVRIGYDRVEARAYFWNQGILEVRHKIKKGVDNQLEHLVWWQMFDVKYENSR